jgi:uncharacterized protein
MSLVADEIDRAAPARRPSGRPAGYHRWHNLLFVHWRLDPAVIEPLLPRDLTLDTWGGSAWVGLVPFAISGLRPYWFPPVPGVSAFNEINVRTYVHYRGSNPGVWFFSLDATSGLAACVTRWRWRLNYFPTDMRLRQTGDIVHYEARRRHGGGKAGARVVACTGPQLDQAPEQRGPGQTIPGTLAHFLLDRYILYAQQGAGPLFTAQVHHAPYCVRESRLLACEQTLLAVSGIMPDEPPCHVAFCERADVEVFPLRRV